MKKLFNVNGSDAKEDQQIFDGNATGILNLNDQKYGWVNGFYRVMMGNHWIPERVSMVEDKVTIKNLTPEEATAVKDTLSFLIFLDSMQVNNLPNIGDHITHSGVKNLITIQAFQETVHSQSYQYILESLYPSIEREQVYNRWRTNEHLKARNEHIANYMQDFVDSPTKEGREKVLIANLALEGIYFYCGFNLFDQLASRRKLVQSQKMIDYIRTDEASHVALFTKIIQETMDVKAKENEIVSFLEDSCNKEIEWANHVYGDKILGINTTSTENFVKYLTNKRLRGIGLGEIYTNVENPYSHLEVKARANFFESSTNTDYSRSEAVGGWDDF